MTKGRTTTVFLAVLCTACSGTTPSSTSQAGAPYIAQMETICITTADELEAVPQPTDDSAVGSFAIAVAGILQSEADAARALDPPSGRAADHRAFVANTDQQARGWLELSEIAAVTPDQITDQTTQIAQLTLGRDDLAAEMGLPACRRGD